MNRASFIVLPSHTSYMSQQSFLSSTNYSSLQRFSPPKNVNHFIFYLPGHPLPIAVAITYYICISTPAELSNFPPCLGNCLRATYMPLSRSTASHTMAMPPLPRRHFFLKPWGHLLPNCCFSWSVRRTYFLGSSADLVLIYCLGLKAPLLMFCLV